MEILDTILDDDQSEFYRIENAGDIIISVDGAVHFNTFYLNRNNRKYGQNIQQLMEMENILSFQSLTIGESGDSRLGDGHLRCS